VLARLLADLLRLLLGQGHRLAIVLLALLPSEGQRVPFERGRPFAGSQDALVRFRLGGPDLLRTLSFGLSNEIKR